MTLCCMSEWQPMRPLLPCQSAGDLQARPSNPLMPADERHLAQIALDTAEDGVFWFREDGRIFRANPALSRLLGHDADRLRSFAVADLVPALTGCAWDCYWRKLVERRSVSDRQRLHRADGTVVTATLAAQGVMLDGRTYGCAFVRNAGTADPPAPDWRLAAVEAERANEAKSAFLAAISHELRTPLNAILGFSEVLSSELFGPLGHDRYRGYAQDIHSSGTHLLRLINNLLDLSKIEAQQLVLDESPVAVPGLIEACLVLVRP